MTVKLSTFRNSWYSPGRSRTWQALWFFLGSPILRCSVLPSSSIRVFLLRAFGARIGSGVVIKPGVRIKNPWRLSVGDHCWLGEDCWIDNIGDVVIEDDVCISQGAYLCTGNHDWSDTAFGLIVKPIYLHQGSWVGARALIAPGVALGKCSIAAAGSIVRESVAPYQIVGGNPAVFLRSRVIKPGVDAEAAPSDTLARPA